MKIEKIFLFLAVPCIALFMFLMPVTEAPDEGMHASMAWNIFYDNSKTFEWLKLHQTDVINNESPAPADVNKGKYIKFFTEKKDFSSDVFSPKFSIKSIIHLPQAIGMLIGKAIYPSLGVIMTCGRLFNALVYIIGIYFLIKSLQAGKLTMLFISLLPMMLQQAASLSYDVLNYVIIAAFFVFYVNLFSDRKFSNKRFIELIILVFALWGSKSNNLLLLPFLAMIDFEFEGVLTILNPIYEFLKKYRKYFIIAVVLLGVVGLYFFLKSRGGTQHFIWAMFNTFFLNQENGHLNTFLTIGIFGYFGWLAVALPLWLIFIDIAVLIIIFFSEDFQATKLEGNASALVFPLQVLAIVVGMYFAWTPHILGPNANISQGAQGRYFTPFLIYLAPLFSIYKSKFDIKMEQKSIIKLSTIIILINVAVSFAVLWAYYWV